jgi:hypothetical protein
VAHALAARAIADAKRPVSIPAWGAKLETLPEMVVRGWKVGRDSRLKPGETRHESFRVNLKEAPAPWSRGWSIAMPPTPARR